MPYTNADLKESLSRYLDGDLAAGEAADLAAQLSRDAKLQEELAQLKAVRRAVRRQAVSPAPTDVETARLRTFARFRANAESSTWQETPERMPNSFWRSWRPFAVTALGAVVVVGAYLLPSPMPTPQETTAARVAAHKGMGLPGDRELSLLYDLHDAHGAPLSTDDMALQRHHTARAQADLLDYADSTVAETL